MNGLPAGWASAAISDVATVNPPPGEPLPPDTEVSFVPMAAVEAESGRIDTSTVRPFAELRKKSYRAFEEGDVLFAKITPCMENGKAAVARNLKLQRGFGSTEFHVLRPHSGINPDFLLYFVLQKQFRDTAARNMKGTAGQLRVPTSYLAEQRVPIPPTAEQRRIVAAIEEHFSRLDAGAAALTRARRNLMSMRSAIYEAATAEWVGQEAQQVRFGDILREPLRNGHSAKADPQGHIPILTLTAVTYGDFGSHNVKMTAADPRRVRGLWIQPGDLLIERSNTRELVGTACLYRGAPDYAVYPDLVIRARVNSRVIPEYAELVLKAPRTRQYFRQKAQGISGTMPKIDQRVIESLSLNLPSWEKQAAIVQEAERSLTLLASLEAALELAAKRSSVLRSSLLAAAFSGRLVPQDPVDESASVLLERIAAEGASPNGHRPTRGRKPRMPQRKATA